MSEFRSQTEGIEWPAFPSRQAMPIYAILFQLEHTQWLPPEELEALQFRQLAALLRHARKSVPLYRERLAGLELPPDSPLTPERWLRLPLLQRAEIQAAGERLRSSEVPSGHGHSGEIFTSGSTGRPVRVLRTQLWGYMRAALTMRDHLWHRRDPAGKLAAIRDSTKGKALYPEGSQSRSWSPTTSQVFRNGPGVSLNINTPLEQQVEWLQRHDPDYLLTFPTVVRQLADHCVKHGIRLPRLRQVETISEIVTPETRRACREAWGVPLIDIYSSREAGYLALQCPDHEHYHVQSEGLYLEVLDEAGRPCGPGEVGRVVVTTLHNFAMPLIRYDIGDHAEVGGPCPCGRGLPVLKRILGRTQNMLTLPSGERRWPLLSSGHIESLLAIGPIRQYQIVQKDYEEIEFRLVAERALTEDEEARLGQWTADKFNHGFRVSVTYHEEIPRSASGKYFDFISEVPAA